MSPSTVRLATHDDIPALKILDPWPSDDIWQQKVTNTEVIVLDVGGDVVGVMRYALLWTTVPFLGLVFIQPEYRGHGYSSQLLTYLKQHLRERGFVALLSSSQTDEPEAQAWHVHMGFGSNGIIENIADDNVGELVYRLML
ncbi:MAG: GNAT family N-acetyltransferase [Deinococcota bacterium]